MRCRSVLKWIVVTAISLAIVFLLSTVAHDDSASAAIDQARPQSQGSLEAFNQNGSPAGECPLKHTEVKAQVSGFISRVTVTQDFENRFTDKIEAVYTFPLPQAAAVDDLTMLIGERVIKGKIMRREEAQAAYAAAKEVGKIATLLDQERPNVFTQQVANIMPGQSIRIVISYVETLKYENGSYEWSFPMVVGSRYLPADANSEETSAPSNQVDDASRITPPSAAAGVRAGHDISLEIDLDAGVPIVGVNSETHETEVQQINEKRAVGRLKDHATIPNKDFVLTYRVAGDTINDAVLTHRSERGGFFTLILQPPQRVTAEDVMPKELVFVLDTSGSMEGFPLEKAKETMDLALNSLYPHDTFNLITFAGDTHILFPTPVPDDPLVAGGRRLNPAAFVLPEGVQQGNLSRNSLRAFPLYQVDMALRRRFNFSEAIALQIQADAFNLFNHANFEDPLGNDLVVGSRFADGSAFTQNLAFGQSTAMSGRSLSGGGFPSFYSFGGPRTLRFSVKLLF